MSAASPYTIIGSNVITDFNEALTRFGPQVEIEVRFNEYSFDTYRKDIANLNSKKQQPRGVSRQTFTRLYNVMAGMSAPYLYEETIDQKDNDGNRRKSQLEYVVDDEGNVVIDETGQPSVNEIITWDRKVRLNGKRGDNYNFNLRVAISREQPINPIGQFVPTVERIKKRHSFFIGDGTYRLDLTEVSQLRNGGVLSTNYEAELEMVFTGAPAVGWESAYEKQIQFILRVILDTYQAYTVKEYKEIVKFYNDTMYKSSIEGGLEIDKWANPRQFDHRQIYKPRNLHHHDMVYGGLVGNGDTAYTITRKADGEHRLLVIHNRKIWLIQPRSEASLVYRAKSSTSSDLLAYYDRLNGIIIEGELIPHEKRLEGAPDNYYMFLAFDCLSQEGGNTSIQQQPLLIVDGDNYYSGGRLNKLNSIIRLIKYINDQSGEIMSIYMKQFKPFYSTLDFYAVFSRMNDVEDKAPYLIDGYVFTPIRMPYNSGNADLPLHKRVLTSVPDICKWKPSVDEYGRNMWTVDLMVKSNIDGYSLYTKTLYKKIVPFVGTKNYPLTSDMVDWTTVEPYFYPGMVGEFEWDESSQMLKMVGVRFDKQYRPNRIDFAKDTWDLARDPITTDTMRGDSIRLMRKYHNRVKREVIKEAFNDLGCRREEEGVTVLDLGSGRGGDAFKYKNYAGGVFVEPNPDYISELQRRLALAFEQDYVTVVSDNTVDLVAIGQLAQEDRVIIINTGGENTELITNVTSAFLNGPADVVSMMLSLSFFWQNVSIYNDLIETIKNNISDDGQFIYLTIDGDIVEQAFNPAFGDGIKSTKWDNYAGSIELNQDDKSVDITLKGTIVEQQHEWLVRLNDLSFSLGGSNMIMSNRYRADQELFLSSFGKALSSLYTYGRILKLV